MSQTRINTDKLLSFIAEKFQNDELNNESMVQIIELCVDYLNLKTIPIYANDNGNTYNGAKKPTKSKEIRVIFGVKFIIDNE